MPEDSPQTALSNFLSSRAALPAGLFLTVAACVLLLYVESAGSVCFGTLLIAIAAYMIPRLFGMRDLRRLLIWGLLVLFLISGVGMLITNSFYASEESLVVSSPDGVLKDASVDPHLADASGVYRFTVLLTEGTFDGITLSLGEVESVYLKYVMSSAAPAAHPMSVDAGHLGAGTLYYVDVPLAEGKNHYFTVKAETAGETVHETVICPYPALRGDDSQFYFAGNLYYLALNVGLPYFLLAFFSWWIRRNMDLAIERMREEGRIPPMETECPQCGNMNPTALKQCRQCGGPMPGLEPLRPPAPEKAASDFVCSECGAEVDEEDSFCPRCGEPFED